MQSNESHMSLTHKIRTARAVDPAFDKAHRIIQIIMGVWALIVILDRAIGLVMNAYGSAQLPFAVLGGAILIFSAFMGTRGHIQGAMIVMQINMSVVLIQFVATCFVYRENTMLWSVLFYGFSSMALVAGFLTFFLNRKVEAYRIKLAQLKGKGTKGPLFYRTNNRLVRNKNR